MEGEEQRTLCYSYAAYFHFQDGEGCRFMGTEPHKYTCHILHPVPDFLHVTPLCSQPPFIRTTDIPCRNPSTTRRTRVPLFGGLAAAVECVMRKLSENSPCLASQSVELSPLYLDRVSSRALQKFVQYLAAYCESLFTHRFIQGQPCGVAGNLHDDVGDARRSE